MTKRTRAANATPLFNAAPLPIEDPGRRAALASAGAAAMLAAIGTPAAAAPALDLDAALWALRLRWLAARAAYAAETIPHTAEYVAAIVALPAVPWQASGEEGHKQRQIAIQARREAFDAIERQWPQPTMSPEAEARQEQALDDEGDAMNEIAALPARTLAGLGFKVEVSAANDHLSPELVASIMADVAAFAAAHQIARI